MSSYTDEMNAREVRIATLVTAVRVCDSEAKRIAEQRERYVAELASYGRTLDPVPYIDLPAYARQYWSAP